VIVISEEESVLPKTPAQGIENKDKVEMGKNSNDL